MEGYTNGTMATRAQRRFVTRVLLWALIAALGFIAVVGSLAAWHVFVKERDAKRALEVAESDFAGLEERKGDLEGKLDALSTERGVEDVIRERFPLVKEGEEVITIVNPKGGSAPPVSGARKSFWEVIGSWFSW